MKAIKQTLLAIALAGAFNNANAIPVDWTLDKVFFDHKSFVTVYINGSFTYDADTNLFTNVSIGLYRQNRDSGAFWRNFTISTTSSASNIIFSNTLPTFGSAGLSFASSLSNSGGVVALSGGHLDGWSLRSGQSITGTPRATAVPEPEAYAMMLAGLGLVGFAARRKLS